MGLDASEEFKYNLAVSALVAKFRTQIFGELGVHDSQFNLRFLLFGNVGFEEFLEERGAFSFHEGLEHLK